MEQFRGFERGSNLGTHRHWASDFDDEHSFWLGRKLIKRRLIVQNHPLDLIRFVNMSSDVTVVLPDGSERTLGPNATGADLAADLGGRAAKDALIAIANGIQLDLNQPLPDGSDVSLVFPASDEGLEVLRHSTAHVLAQAVLDLYPGATFSIGPPIEDGFYYDFDLPNDQTFSDEDLEQISSKMKEIVNRKQPFIRSEVDRAEADILLLLILRDS